MIFKIFGLALIGAIISFVLKAFGWRGAPVAAIATILTLMAVFAEGFEKIGAVFEIATEAEGVKEVGEYLLKILGIGYLSGICSDVCRELGEGGIASAVITVARIESFAVISPLIIEVMTLGLELVR